MEQNFLCPIKSEKDLSVYEDYLKKQREMEMKSLKNSDCGNMTIENSISIPSSHKLADTSYMPAYLRGMIGKLVRVESLMGNRLETRIGTLMTVGADYIVLKLFKGCSTMICEFASVKYITVVHDNDLNKMGLL